MAFRSLIASLLALPLLCAAPARAETVTLGGDIWCPYNCAEGGYMIEIARDIFQRNNIEIDYQVMPWSDAVNKARQGEIDATVGTSHDDAPDFIFPQSLQGMADMRFWVRDDSQWVFSGIPSLEKMKLGVIADYAYSKDLNAYIKQNATDSKRIYVAQGKDALEQNLQKLLKGELDVVAEDDNVINYYITTKSAEYKIKSVGTPVKRENIADNYLYIAFSPKNPKSQKYAAMLDAGMQELRQGGELGRILELYRVNDWYGISKK